MDAMEDISDSESGIWENSSLNALLFATIPGVANRRNPKMPAATRLYPAVIPSGIYFDHSSTKPRITSTMTRITAI